MVHDLSINIPDGTVTTIQRPTVRGRLRLPRTPARLLHPSGSVVLPAGQPVATELGVLGQQVTTLDAITIEDLAWRGRYSHHSTPHPLTHRDLHALGPVRVTELRKQRRLHGKATTRLPASLAAGSQ